MTALACWLSAGSLLLPLTAPTQESDGAAPGPAPAPQELELFDGIDGGSGEFAPVQLDDSIPLPIPAVVRPGPDGDVRIAPASGDPYFLGFVAGPHYPPADERVDPDLRAAAAAIPNDGRPAPETYAYVMFARRITPERIAELESLGARVLGFHPHYTLRVALPAASVDALSDHPAVRWVGLARTWQKLHPELTAELERTSGDALLDVYVNVFESDLNEASVSVPLVTPETTEAGLGADDPGVATLVVSHGWQQRALEAAGVEVREYVDAIAAFRARLRPSALQGLVALDLVQFVELDTPPVPAHDESTPMIHIDSTRNSYDGGFSQRAVAGFLDSGYEYDHQDLNHAWGVGWNFTGVSGASAWDDGYGHGTHVAGTILGNGEVVASYRGNAPGLGWSSSGRFFNARIFNDSGGYGGASLSSIINVMDGSYTDGSGNVTQRPHVINNSWGAPAGNYTGTEADCRLLDQNALVQSQLWVFAAGNSGLNGSKSIWKQASSKNVFTVGSVNDYKDGSDDPGTLSDFSSRGPTGDGRWKPNVVAPGAYIRSARASNSTGHVDFTGTSMAAPHVTGLAAQLVDHYSSFSYQPWRVAAVLMATALRRNDTTISTPSSAHLDQYGTGRVEALRANWGTSDWTWSSWDVDARPFIVNYMDFTVDSNTTRLVAVMHYHEQASSSGASQALVNDYDLWLDQAPIQQQGNAGEWFAQQSALDNTEIRVLNNPQPGAWRWKIYPDSVTSAVQLSVVILQVKADTTPPGSLSITSTDTFVQPGDTVGLTATATCDDFIASGVFLDSTVSGGPILTRSETTLRDGAVSNLLTNASSGYDVLLGNILFGQSRSATWDVHWNTEGNKSWTITARSENWGSRFVGRNIIVDGTPPASVTNLVSTSHTPNEWSNDTTIDFTWTTAFDNLSGISGYSDWLRKGGPALPNAVQDFGAVTSHTSAGGTSTSGWYYNLRSVDLSGNWGTTSAVAGPYLLDTVSPTAASGLASTSHTVGVPSCDTTIQMSWTAATDAHSGVDGYIAEWNSTPVFDPTGAPNVGGGTTTLGTTHPSSSQPLYLHLRPVDQAGNLGPTVHAGPYFVDDTTVATYCTGKVNSAGCAPAVSSIGQPDLSDGSFLVTCAGVVNNKLGHLFWGRTPGAVPFQHGIKCVKAPTKRTPNQSSGGSLPPTVDCTGSYAFQFTTAYMQAKGIAPGDTIYCQFWYRDPASPGTTGLSNAIQFTVCD